MRLPLSRRFLGVEMPLADLFVLICLREFRELLERFPKLIRIELLRSPYQVVVNASVIPLFCQVSSSNRIFRKACTSLVDASQRLTRCNRL